MYDMWFRNDTNRVALGLIKVSSQQFHAATLTPREERPCV
jgi:hypothetical protein